MSSSYLRLIFGCTVSELLVCTACAGKLGLSSFRSCCLRRGIIDSSRLWGGLFKLRGLSTKGRAWTVFRGFGVRQGGGKSLPTDLLSALNHQFMIGVPGYETSYCPPRAQARSPPSGTARSWPKPLARLRKHYRMDPNSHRSGSPKMDFFGQISIFFPLNQFLPSINFLANKRTIAIQQARSLRQKAIIFHDFQLKLIQINAARDGRESQPPVGRESRPEGAFLGILPQLFGTAQLLPLLPQLNQLLLPQLKLNSLLSAAYLPRRSSLPPLHCAGRRVLGEHPANGAERLSRVIRQGSHASQVPLGPLLPQPQVDLLPEAQRPRGPLRLAAGLFAPLPQVLPARALLPDVGEVATLAAEAEGGRDLAAARAVRRAVRELRLKIVELPNRPVRSPFQHRQLAYKKYQPQSLPSHQCLV